MMTDEHETPDETAARIMSDLLTPTAPSRPVSGNLHSTATCHLCRQPHLVKQLHYVAGWFYCLRCLSAAA